MPFADDYQWVLSMIKIILALILAYLMMTLVSCQWLTPFRGEEAQISRIISGQTIELMIKGEKYSLRLTGLDLVSSELLKGENPEKFIVQLLTNNGEKPLQSVKVNVETNLQKKDKFGRINGYIWHNNKLLNRQLLEKGYALTNLTYTDGKYDQQLIDGQTYGRIMKQGFWVGNNE